MGRVWFRIGGLRWRSCGLHVVIDSATAAAGAITAASRIWWSHYTRRVDWYVVRGTQGGMMGDKSELGRWSGLAFLIP